MEIRGIVLIMCHAVPTTQRTAVTDTTTDPKVASKLKRDDAK